MANFPHAWLEHIGLSMSGQWYNRLFKECNGLVRVSKSHGQYYLSLQCSAVPGKRHVYVNQTGPATASLLHSSDF